MSPMHPHQMGPGPGVGLPPHMNHGRPGGPGGPGGPVPMGSPMGGIAGMGGMSPMGGMGGPSISPHHMGMGGLSPMGGGPNGPNPRAMQGSPMGGPGQNSPMNSLPMGSPMGNPIGSPLGPPSGPGPGNPGNTGGPQQQQQQPPQPPMNNGQMGPPPLHSPLGNGPTGHGSHMPGGPIPGPGPGPGGLVGPGGISPRTAITRVVLGTTCSAGIPAAATATTTEAIQVTPATTIKILTSRQQPDAWECRRRCSRMDLRYHR